MPIPPDLDVRPLVPGDLDAVIGLIGRCDRTYLEWAPAGWQPPELGWYRDRWERRMRDPEHWARGAFDREGGLRGLVAWLPELDAEGCPRPGVAHVSAVFVDPPRWREGIAGALLALAEDAMRACGFSVAHLFTPAGSPAERLYETCGWQATGERDWFAELGLAVVGYRKPLTSPS